MNPYARQGPPLAREPISTCALQDVGADPPGEISQWFVCVDQGRTVRLQERPFHHLLAETHAQHFRWSDGKKTPLHVRPDRCSQGLRLSLAFGDALQPGFPPPLPRSIYKIHKKYLTERRFRFAVGRPSSTSRPVLSRVPQCGLRADVQGMCPTSTRPATAMAHEVAHQGQRR